MKLEIYFVVLLCFSVLACKRDSPPASVQAADVSSATPIANADDREGVETYNTINASILNGRLGMADRKMEVEDIAKLLFIPSNGSGEGPNISITKVELENGNIETTIISTNAPGSNIAAEKFLMVLSSKNAVWQIVSLKKNWRCTKERTSQIWGIGKCL